MVIYQKKKENTTKNVNTKGRTRDKPKKDRKTKLKMHLTSNQTHKDQEKKGNYVD